MPWRSFVEGPVATVLGLVVIGAVFGAGMYLLVYRRFVRDAVRDPAEPPTPQRELPGRTRSRVVVATVPLLVLLAAAAVALQVPSVVGATAAGNGAAMLLTSRWLRTWERVRRSQIVREPRWRFSRSGRGGWARRRGMMDAQDFYASPR